MFYIGLRTWLQLWVGIGGNVSTGAEWETGGGLGGAASVEVGGAGGGGAVVIPEGPGKLQEVRRCAPVNRHVER